MDTPALDADQLIDAARTRTGLDDFDGDTFRLGLDRLVDGLHNEARLNEAGQAVAPESLTGALATRLEVIDWHRKNPDMGAKEPTSPVFMIGMGRTGTTILHDLLAQDPATRTALTWEVDRPIPPPEEATADDDPRIAEVQAGIDMLDQIHPEFKTMHPTGALLAQECVRITGNEFASVIWLSQYASPSYMDWVINHADMVPTYEWHKKFLQLLQWHRPRDRWVLKSGAHLWALPALLEVYPNAFFIQTHRDPLRIIPSISSLFAVVRSTFSDEVTIANTAAEWCDPIIDGLDRSVDARECGLLPADRIVDVQFEALMADPFTTIKGIYDAMGEEYTLAAETAMRGFLAEHERDKHGQHRYSIEDTGYDAGELRERSRRYQEYFDVPSEPVR